jgi:hypothetical protein
MVEGNSAVACANLQSHGEQRQGKIAGRFIHAKSQKHSAAKPLTKEKILSHVNGSFAF